MLDINFIRKNPEKVKKGVAAKQFDPALVDRVLSLYGDWTQALQEYEKLRQERSKIAKGGKYSEKGKKLKEKLKKKELEVVAAHKAYLDIACRLPNLPAADVKVGKDESENQVIRKWGEPPKFDFEPQDHLELGEKLGIIDVGRAAKVSGTRFGYLKGEAVLLEFALTQLVLEKLMGEGFTPVVPPVLIKTEMMKGMGHVEHGGIDDMYVLDQDNLILVGTSEQSIGPMHANEVLAEEDLPLRYVGFSTCFRREAGSYGKDTRGILRVHQFDKLEMFSFTKAGRSDEEHEYLLNLEEKLFQAIKVPYQVVKMCSADLGAPFVRKYDLEAWMPGQGKYREVTSTSNTTDFQSRRLNIKYREGKGGLKFVHTLNGTGFAIGRTIIAILENYQQKDGSVVIPEILRQWVGKEVIEIKRSPL